jgi:3-methyladenine DNA glycosylase/8-oxoguanine DNA glycosylase
MASIIARVSPFRLNRRPAAFEALLRAIVFQQLAMAAANTIYQRLQNSCEQAVGSQDTERSLYLGFQLRPTAVAVGTWSSHEHLSAGGAAPHSCRASGTLSF